MIGKPDDASRRKYVATSLSEMFYIYNNYAGSNGELKNMIVSDHLYVVKLYVMV
jgi:hypothetical protein